MKHFLLLCTILLACLTQIFAQNLVSNSSFETVTSEPYYGCEFTNATGWLNPANGTCPNNGVATPDIFSTFSTGQAVLPNSFLGTTSAHTGNRCAGILTYHQQLTNYREYMMTRLTCALVPGTTYTVSFWTTGGTNSKYVYHTNNVGVYFSTSALSQTGYNLITGITPQFEETALVANTSWTLYSYTFTPTQAYNYITIGNFRSDANTTVTAFGTNAPYGYYFFDDVSVVPANTSFNLGNDTSYCGNFSRTLSTGNANTLWSTGVTASQITVTTPGTYWASIAGVCGSSTSDTITISSVPGLVVNLGNDTTLCAGQNVTLNAGNAGSTYQWQDNSTNATFSVTAAGTYAVTVTNAAGCSGSDAINVAYSNGPPVFDLGNDTTYCGSFSRVLTTGNAATVWSTGATASQITVTFPGTYTATLSNGCGSTTDNIVLNQNAAPVVNLGNDTALCTGQSLILDAGNAGSTYQWQDNSVSATFSVTVAGNYSVIVTNPSGCTASDAINITYTSNPPAVNLGNDTTYCGPFARLLSTGNAFTVWSTGVTAAQITINTAGIFWAEQSNGCGTTRDSIVFIQLPAPTVSLGSDTSICNGQTVVFTAVSSSPNLVWSDGSIGNTLSVSAVGLYWVETSEAGCKSRDSVVVSAGLAPAFNLGIDTTVCGDEFTLSVHADNAQYQWQDLTSDSVYTVTVSGNYSVTVSNACGSATDEVTVNIERNRCDILVPTGFSPNNDGANDLFRAICSCPVSRYTMHVYNRWGEEVFETDDIREGWNGMFRGRPQPLSVYVYYIDYFNYCEQKMKKIIGNVTLVK